MPNRAAAIDGADVAFVGTVVDVHDPNAGPMISTADPITFRFAVREPLKGPAAETLDVSTARDGSSCGAGFGMGQTWFVAATMAGGTLQSSLCGGNELLPDDALPALAPVPPASQFDPRQILLVASVVAAVIALSAWAFVRRPRAPDA